MSSNSLFKDIYRSSYESFRSAFLDLSDSVKLLWMGENVYNDTNEFRTNALIHNVIYARFEND